MFVCCKACEETAELIGSCLCPENRPSPLFTLWTFILNTIIIIIGIAHFSADSGLTCTSSTQMWNGVIFGICGMNMIFSVYIYIRFTQKIQAGEAAGKAANQLFMYDFGVYFYMWFIVFQIIWIAISGSYNNEAVCTALSSTGATTSLIVLYVVGGFFVVILSLMTECCRQPRWAGEHQQQQGGVRPQPARASYQPMAQSKPAHVYAQPVPPPPAQQQQQHQQQFNPLPPQGNHNPPATNPSYGQPTPYGQQPQHQGGNYNNQPQHGGGTYAQPQQQQQQRQQQGGIMGKMNNAVNKIF